MLAVTDTGTGMDADTRARIFEPFFTTKAPDKGTGLGLATVYGIVKQSAGEIFVYSEPGLGTTFKVFLPCSTEVATPRNSGPVKLKAARGNETVLVAEDEAVIRTIIKRGLEKAGYTVLLTENGDAALRVLESHASPIHLLLTDMTMPGMSGSELAQRARALHPELRVLFLSGYTRTAAANHNGIQTGDSFLQKPFATEKLVATAREVLDATE